MTKFSANLGFLWTELSLPDAIRAAASAKFDAVECHWPYETDPSLVADALGETRLQMLSLNTIRGGGGQNGLSALPGRKGDAKAAIDQAIRYANAINAPSIHVMAGIAKGSLADAVYCENLKYASDRAAEYGKTILIEPINQHDSPGYFLSSTDHAVKIIERVGRNNLKLLVDCYHLYRMNEDVLSRIQQLFPLIGHIQIASVPGRHEPDHEPSLGVFDYPALYAELWRLGYRHPLGAEYHPLASVEAGLDWLSKAKALKSPSKKGTL